MTEYPDHLYIIIACMNEETVLAYILHTCRVKMNIPAMMKVFICVTCWPMIRLFEAKHVITVPLLCRVAWTISDKVQCGILDGVNK